MSETELKTARDKAGPWGKVSPLPAMTNPIFINAELQGADVFILDLEDSVHYAGKDAARILVRTCVPLISANANARFASIGYSGAVDPAEVIPEVADVVLIPAVERRNK